jgi:hypothetical protein
MNRKWLLDLSYMIRSSLATVVATNCISADVKVLHIVIQDLGCITVPSLTNVFDYEAFQSYLPPLLS